MATGDNVQTAISVARQCSMIQPTKPCFLGELVQGDSPYVKWRSTSPSQQEIDEESLNPSYSINFVRMTSTEPTIGKSDRLPWHYKDSNVEVAVTGAAFRHIIQKKDSDPYTYYSVCHKT
jgi:cation-transporting P-type ATPase 13A2